MYEETGDGIRFDVHQQAKTTLEKTTLYHNLNSFLKQWSEKRDKQYNNNNIMYKMANPKLFNTYFYFRQF